MATIERLTLENTWVGEERWDAVATHTGEWVRGQGVALRDACVLVPFAQLLPLARRAFARRGGWMPRIETTSTLAASFGPSPPAAPGQVSFDVALDVLAAADLLRSQAWGAAWAQRDPRGFDQAAGALVHTAHELLRASFAMPPVDRPAHWVDAREVLAPLAGPGATERALARLALEWACLAPPPATDRLFAIAPPSAWIAVQAGGPDALTARLMADARVACLMIDTDAPENDPFSRLAPRVAPAYAVCESFEHEAQCTAAQVLTHVQQGDVPVALIAQDRVLVRRVRALLERESLRLLDETGWTLSTTRAAAQVMALLRAARPDAGTDALLDWLKGGTVWSRVGADDVALSALEAACRRAQVARVSALGRARLEPEAAHLWTSARAVLMELSAVDRRPLPLWMSALAAALTRCGAMRSLQSDDAGRQVIAALRLVRGDGAASAWPLGGSPVAMGFDAFVAWIDALLEQTHFVPTARFDDPAQVIITPLARAMLRPFGAVVLPGADDRHLGAPAGTGALLSDAQAAALGVPTMAHKRCGELLAFVQLLAAPHITLMRRRVDGNDPLADSPLVERLSLALASGGRSLRAWLDPRIELPLVPTPIRMTAPSAAALLPARLSASACEALRACPYRFFALHMLRLREEDELEREIEKRDFGTWLHALLLEFHQSREAPAASHAEVARLLALAAASRAVRGLDDADFLPFAASFASFAPRYVAWLHKRDREGARWLRGEDDISAQPEALAGTGLRGIIDRVDEVHSESGITIQLIDYKTGGVAGLKDKVRQPFEDTQLAFYAALMRTRTELPLQAMYLGVDATRGIDEVAHPGVEASAAALIEGLAQDLKRLRAGAGLPALGVGSTCEHCAARGVCRRDHWADDAAPATREAGA